MKMQYPCPCGGKIECLKKTIEVQGVDCGVLDVEYCSQCGSEYFPEESMAIIQQRLKDAHLWGTGRSEITFWKSGNTVVMRLPVRLANALNIKEHMKAMLYREGKNKLVVEI